MNSLTTEGRLGTEKVNKANTFLSHVKQLPCILSRSYPVQDVRQALCVIGIRWTISVWRGLRGQWQHGISGYALLIMDNVHIFGILSGLSEPSLLAMTKCTFFKSKMDVVNHLC